MTNLFILLPIVIPLLFFLITITKKIDSSNIKKSYFLFLSFNILITAINIFTKSSYSNKILNYSLISFSTDSLSIIFLIISSVLWIFVSIYSFGYFLDNRKKNIFFSFLMAAYGATVGICYSSNLITFFIFFEILSICSFFMIIYNGTDKAFISAKKFISYSLSSSIFIFIGILLIYNKIGTLSFINGGSIAPNNELSKFDILLPYFIIFVGFGIKAALVPLHGWLPQSMSAPTPVCALILEVITVNTAILGLIRVTYYIFGWQIIDSTIGNNTMLIFVLLNLVLGSLLAVHQKNLKKRLAYSTISQLSYIMFCIVLFDKDIFIGSLLHLCFHAINKVILFLCVGNIIEATGKSEIDEIAGIGKYMPKTMFCFTISTFSLIGIPPGNAFISKWYIATGGISLGKYFVPFFLLLSAFFTALYLVPIISTAFFKGNEIPESSYKELNNEMLNSIIGLTILNILSGVFPNELIYFIRDAANALF